MEFTADRSPVRTAGATTPKMTGAAQFIEGLGGEFDEPDVDATRSATGPSDGVYRRYWLALYRRDVGVAGQIVERCLRCWRPGRLYLDLFEPALILSGTLFEKGRITYRDEHFVTHHTLQFLRRVRREFLRDRPAPPPAAPLALATGVEQESHVIGLRMVC